MSTAAIIPPPNSSSVTRNVPRLTARARALLTEMNLHLAGIAALMILLLYLAIHLLFVWQALKANGPDAQAAQRIELKKAQIAAQPLHNIDDKLKRSTEDADAFYAARLPYAYSEIAAELGVLTKKTGVRLGHVQYAGEPMLTDTPHPLELVRMDASVAGDYRPIVQFINALERDKQFFVINSINLSGQQSGLVNLRIRMSTYKRDPNEKEAVTEDVLPDTPDEDAAPAGGKR